ncbi:hypothetical protein [Nitrosomonas supralitoralis]|uniref:Uncharacterized protein n=1 Tax=Nitrosomonas supralitoralis TaxID=2116706 RepID=A0A2P7NT18_9PROT|nr:hypothetical protein [Nitrosomonas supralitoralis]PSJ16578.1 hypothetical protein C7H79_12780 [Nitrosomonas supralitoralis]
MRRYPAYPVILALIISMLTNGLSLSFRGEVFAHELDHIRQALSADPTTHLELHRNNVFWDGIELDAATHLCLHAAGQYQPFFFNSFPIIPDQTVTEVITVFISAFIPETIPDLPLRPPRSISLS